jgi:hypothetical protein
MFKNNSLAGVLSFRNGASVPSIGGSLASALAAVERAEAQLDAARSQAKAAAKREGKSVRNLFADGAFVARSSAEKWVDAARREGEHEGHRQAVDAMLTAQGLDPAEERARIAASSKKERAAREARDARWNAIMADAGFFEATARGDHERAGRIMFEMHDELLRQDAHVLPRATIERMERNRVAGTGKATGAAIVAAGKRARMSADAAGELPKPTGLAAQIVRAGQRRRGEVE